MSESQPTPVVSKLSGISDRLYSAVLATIRAEKAAQVARAAK